MLSIDKYNLMLWTNIWIEIDSQVVVIIFNQNLNVPQSLMDEIDKCTKSQQAVIK